MDHFSFVIATLCRVKVLIGVRLRVNRSNIESFLRIEDIRQSVIRVPLKWCGYNFISCVKILYILK